MKTARRPITVRQAARGGAGIIAHAVADIPATGFRGTANPRHLRVLALLLARPARREEVDRAAGAANGPDLVANLRALGLDVPCARVEALDRDGRACRPGVYHLTARDRCRLADWMRDCARPLPRADDGDLFGGDGGVS